MRKILMVLSVTVSVMVPSFSYANQSTQQLGVCLTDSLNGKERKELAKWMFLSISSHDFIEQYSKATSDDADSSNRYVGKLLTRLIADDCPKQASLAFKESGSLAIQNAFRFVGEVAMQEIMTDQNVARSIGGFEKYLDQERLNAVFQ